MQDCGCRIKYSFYSYQRDGVIITEVRPEIDRTQCRITQPQEQPRPLPPIKTSIQLPETGFLRQAQVLMFIPVSRSTWWNGIKEGRFPKPVRLGPKSVAWRAEDIRKLLEQIGGRSRT